VSETVKLQSLEGWQTLVRVLADNEPTALAEILNQVSSHRYFHDATAALMYVEDVVITQADSPYGRFVSAVTAKLKANGDRNPFVTAFLPPPPARALPL